MYKLTKQNQSVIRKADGACIPFAEGNSDYAAYQEWLSQEGNTPDPAQTPEEIAAELAAETQHLQDITDAADVKAEAKVVALIGKTKAQVKKMADDIMTLDDAKDVIKTLLIIVRILAKRL